jgi:hypothetical protein
MFIINRFCIGKDKHSNKCYKGFSIKIGWLKFERIGLNDKFMWRIEFTNWNN